MGMPGKAIYSQRLPLEIQHTFLKCPVKDYRKKSSQGGGKDNTHKARGLIHYLAALDCYFRVGQAADGAADPMPWPFRANCKVETSAFLPWVFADTHQRVSRYSALYFTISNPFQRSIR